MAPQALPTIPVAGTDHHPHKVTAATGEKKIAKRSKIKSFVKVYNYNHLITTKVPWIPLCKKVLSTRMSSETQLLNMRPKEMPGSSWRRGMTDKNK
ncbi:unnamed protein product [Nyctereutes procyonoides]|uniref:(raccoon dog) hypothetical protein n=1 Tax=Nyctereutes procyonoides TaxID=34880 RepID=A0A811YWR6_NYCPR|nr:unnamed protein product [Nyctereutes procyonoides]